MKFIKIFFFLLVVSYVWIFIFGIPWRDTLVCKAPGSGYFVLTVKYQWDPFAKMIPADVAERSSWGGWRAEYFSEKNVSWKTDISIVATEPNSACGELGVINGFPVTGNRFYNKDGSWQPGELPDSLNVFKIEKYNPSLLNQAIEGVELGFAFDYGLVAPFGDRWVYEIALYEKHGGNSAVLAVIQSSSSNEGLSWQGPVVTKKSQIYKLGVPAEAQPFQARAVSLNGRPVEP